eukprot:COSAG04_NODE_630_length_11765_cov_6.900394_5_plen_245_part_00
MPQASAPSRRAARRTTARTSSRLNIFLRGARSFAFVGTWHVRPRFSAACAAAGRSARASSAPRDPACPRRPPPAATAARLLAPAHSESARAEPSSSVQQAPRQGARRRGKGAYRDGRAELTLPGGSNGSPAGSSAPLPGSPAPSAGAPVRRGNRRSNWARCLGCCAALRSRGGAAAPRTGCLGALGLRARALAGRRRLGGCNWPELHSFGVPAAARAAPPLYFVSILKTPPARGILLSSTRPSL